MSLELKQHLRLSQQLVMTPQLQQAIKLLQLSRLELQDMVRDELEQNPLLEEGLDQEDEQAAGLETREAEPEASPDERKAEEVKGEDGANDFDWENYLEEYQAQPTVPSVSKGNEEMPSTESLLTRKTSLFDHLVWQLRLSAFTPAEEAVGLFIIGNLDDDGYLKIDEFEGDALIHVAQQTGQSLELCERALKKVQLLDPVGVASRDLAECLWTQAKSMGLEHDLVGKILKHHLKEVESKNLPLIAKALGEELVDIIAAVKILTKMEPKPGRLYSGDEPQYITPDVYVYKVGDKYMVVLNDDGLSKLRISGMYKSALKNGGASEKGAKDYIQEKLRSAVWLIRSIHQRQRTIYKVTESIVKFQKDFLDRGIAYLRPLILKDVAQDIGMHESTVSRVTTNKYVHTTQGIYELKYFFNSSINRVSGEDIASEAVKNHIKLLVQAENTKTPYSDQKIVELLRGQGIDIARRTVAKYREVLGILPSSKRRSYF